MKVQFNTAQAASLGSATKKKENDLNKLYVQAAFGKSKTLLNQVKQDLSTKIQIEVK